MVSGERRRAASAPFEPLIVTEPSPDSMPPPPAQPPKPRPLSPAARRALAEATERRNRSETEPAKEIGGRGGPDPVRYGDWEVKGLASDF